MSFFYHNHPVSSCYTEKKSKSPKHTLLILQGLAGFYLCWLHLQQLAPGSLGLVILASLMFFRKVKYTHLPAGPCTTSSSS